MKIFHGLLFLLFAAVALADTPEVTAISVEVGYTTIAQKTFIISADNMQRQYCILPITTDGKRWAISVDADSSKQDGNLDKVTITISDLLALAENTREGATITYPITIFSGVFKFQSGKKVTILKTDDYSVDVTITVSSGNSAKKEK